jgi:hypothetical protein
VRRYDPLPADHCFYSSSDRGDILAGLDRGGVGEIQIETRSKPDWASFFALDIEVRADFLTERDDPPPQ